MDLMESLIPYGPWNQYRRHYTDRNKEPSKVLMYNLEEIYPKLLGDVHFMEFYHDYMEVRHAWCWGKQKQKKQKKEIKEEEGKE